MHVSHLAIDRKLMNLYIIIAIGKMKLSHVVYYLSQEKTSMRLIIIVCKLQTYFLIIS